MSDNRSKEEVKNCLCSVVVVDLEAGDKTQLAIDEGVNHEFILDQASRHRGINAHSGVQK